MFSQSLVIGGLTSLALANVVYFFGGSQESGQQGPGAESSVRIEEVLEPDDLPLCQCPPVPTCLNLHELLRQESLEPLVTGIAGKLLEKSPFSFFARRASRSVPYQRRQLGLG